MRVDIRLCTAIAIIAIGGLSLVQGWKIARFSLTVGSNESSEKGIGNNKRSAAIPSITSTALQADLADEIDASDLQAANRRREALSSILAVKPLSSIHWLLLSGMQLITERPMEQVLESLELSVVTGPNEGYVMIERGIFGVSLWEDLSRDLKSRAALDLGPLIYARTPEEGAKGEKFQAVLETKPESVRNELRKALVATGILPNEIEQRLGL